MKKISIILGLILLFNITFSVKGFAMADKTEVLQLNSYINYAEDDGVLPSGWANHDNNNENTMLKLADSEEGGEKCLSFDCSTKTGRIDGKTFTLQTSGKILFCSRVLFTKSSGLSLSFIGTSDAVRPGVTLYQTGLDDGTWHDMRIVVDITNGTISIGYDGNEPVLKSQNINFSYGLQRYYFANWSTSTSVVKIQNLNIYKYFTEASPIKFGAKTILNENFYFSSGDTVKSGIDKLNIIFDANLSDIGTDIISLKIKSGEGYQTVSALTNFSENTVTITCNEPLEAGREYKIVIGTGITSTANITSTLAHEITFFTDEGDVVAELVKDTTGGIIESYVKTYENDFSDLADFTALSGSMGDAKGLTAIRLNNADTLSGFLTISPSSKGITAFALSIGEYINAGEFVRVSFDYKAPNLDAAPEIQIYANSTSDPSAGLKLANYCGGDAFAANEWQTYHIEIYPNTNTSGHEFKMYRGDDGDSVPKSTFSVDGNTAAGLRLRFTQKKTGEENYQYFDNIRVESKKTYIAETFDTAPQYIMAAGNSYKSGLIYTGNMTVADGVLKGNGTEAANVWLLHAGLSKTVSDITTEIYFKAKLPSGNKVSVSIGNDEYLLSDNNVFGGDAFTAGIWQKYHIVISGNTAKLWRGSVAQFTEAKSNTFSDGSVLEAIIKMVSSADGDIIELDDFSWTIYEEGKEPVKTQLPSSVTARVKNTTANVFKAFIIYSEYSETNGMLGTQYKLICANPNSTEEFVMNFVAPESSEIDNAYAYLWKFNSSMPMSELVIVK